MFNLNTTSRAILLIFLLFIIAQDAFAQNKLYLGIKAGGNVSKTTRSEYSFSNPARFGPNLNSEFGLIANYTISDSLSFQPEILLVKKGYQAFGIYNHEDGKTDNDSYEQWVNNHIEVPLLTKFALGNNKVKFFFAAGPSFSFWNNSYYNRDSTGGKTTREKLKVEHKFRQTTPRVIDTVLVNGKKQLKTISYDSITVKARQEISAVFATGFHYKLKNSMLVFDFRYAYGLTNLYNYLEDKRPLNFEGGIPPTKQPSKTKEYNRRFSFSVSYLFSFKN
ncbi:MAG: porin family protein [Adhaeribacter sp.]